MTDVAALQVQGMTKSFDGVAVVDDVSLTVGPGEIVALVGPNGAGKSTLFDVVSGFTEPDKGSIRLDGRDITRLSPWQRAQAGLGRGFQDVRLAKDLSVLSNLTAAMAQPGERLFKTIMYPRVILRTREVAMQKARSIADRLGLGHAACQPAGTLSFGQQRLLSIGRLMVGEYTALAVDEPFAGLSHEAAAVVERCLQLLVEEGQGLILIDHDLNRAHRIADRVLVMTDGSVEEFPGPSLSGQAHHPRIDLVPKASICAAQDPNATPVVLSVVDLCASYPGREVLINLSLKVRRGEIVAVFGANGSGKSSLLRAIAGYGVRVISGRVEVCGVDLTRQPSHKRVQFGLRSLPQSRSVFLDLNVDEHLDLAEEVCNTEVSNFKNRPQLLGEIPSDRRAGLLSGGQKRRLAISAIQRQGGIVWLLDEPTSGLDTNGIRDVLCTVREAAQRGVAVLLVEQNQEAALAVADRLLEIRDGRLYDARHSMAHSHQPIDL